MTTKVDLATRHDIDILVEMLRHYSQQSPLQDLKDYQNEGHVRKLLTNMLLGMGKIWITRNENKIPTGMLMSIRSSNIWNPDIVFYSELAYWVEPEFRGGLSGYKLLKSYIDFCQNLLSMNKINYYTATKMSTSPDINFHRLGFRKLEETWIREE